MARGEGVALAEGQWRTVVALHHALLARSPSPALRADRSELFRPHILADRIEQAIRKPGLARVEKRLRDFCPLL